MRVHEILMVTTLLFGAGALAACDQDAKPKQEPAAAQSPAELARTIEIDRDSPPRKTTDGQVLPFEALGPVAIIDDDVIGAEEFNAKIDKLVRIAGANFPPQMAQVYKQQMLQRVVDEHLLQEEIERAKIVIKDEDIQKEYDSFVARFKNKEQFDMYFKRTGMSEEEMREDIRARLSQQELLDASEVSDAEVKKFYDENVDRFREEEEVKARHVLFKLPKDADDKAVKAAEKKAMKVIKEAKKEGADFGEIAKEYSEGPSAERGGDLGMFPRKRMIEAFSNAAFKLEPGEISEPVRTDFGVHVIKVEERKPEKIKPLDEVKEMIEQTLIATKLREGMTTKLTEIKNKRKIELLEDNIRLNVKVPAQPAIPGLGGPGGAHGAHGHPHGAGGAHPLPHGAGDGHDHAAEVKSDRPIIIPGTKPADLKPADIKPAVDVEK